MAKRKNEHIHIDNENAETAASESLSPSETSSAKEKAPSYGSKEYWEKRYQKKKKKPNNQYSTEISPKNDHKEGETNDNEDDDDDDLAGHEWYFSYSELKPLILPLILGREDEAVWSDLEDGEDGEADYFEEVREDSDHSDDDGEEKEQKLNDDPKSDTISKVSDMPSSDTCTNGIKEKDKDNVDRCTVDAGDSITSGLNESCVNFGEDAGDNESGTSSKENSDPNPKRILEIGCGDMPLSSDLCEDLIQMQKLTGADANLVVERIVSFDYSENVINQLIQQQKEENKQQCSDDGKQTESNHAGKSLNVEYVVLDARNLPYEDGQFDLIIDKGTLDAMLSDSQEGIDNSIKIVTESSRVLASGGYLVIVSHLNANIQSGLDWIDNVVVEGLRAGDSNSSWQIEVHSNEAPADGSDSEDGQNIDQDDIQGGTKDVPGPAVYIIKKVGATKTPLKPDSKNDEEEIVLSRVSMKFFYY